MSAVISGLIGGIAAVALAGLANRKQHSARAAPNGWKKLRAGWFVNMAIIVSVALAAFFAYFLLIGGSSRPDADVQNRYAVLLIVVFGAGALYTSWTAYGRTISWKGNRLRVSTIWRRQVVRRLSDVSAMTKSDALGEYRLTFRDGSTLRFSTYFDGAQELVATIPRSARGD